VTRTGFGLACALLCVAACRDKLPSAPSELTMGVVVYEHANFLGSSAYITTDIPNLRDLRGPCETVDSDGQGFSSTTDSWDDCVSSIKVAPGWRATLYEDRNYKGWAADIGEENVTNYQLVRGPCRNDTFNDCASSLRVFRRP